MSDRIKKIKIKQADGTFSDYIPIGANAKDIDLQYNGSNVENTLKKKPYYYDSVAAMKLDDTLKEGDMAITLGYYEANDGGGAEYRIISDESLNDDDGSIHNLGNGLKAKLIVNDSINIKQFGTKGDGITDDILSIENVLNYCELNKISKILIPSGTYIVSKPINLINDCIFTGLTNDVYFGISNNFQYCKLFSNKENAISNIYIKNINVNMDDIHFKNQGNITRGIMAFEKVNNIVFDNISLHNNYSSSSPQAVENQPVWLQSCNNITIKNSKIIHYGITSSGKGNGIWIFSKYSNVENIKIHDCYIEGYGDELIALFGETYSNTIKNVEIFNNILVGPMVRGIMFNTTNNTNDYAISDVKIYNNIFKGSNIILNEKIFNVDINNNYFTENIVEEYTRCFSIFIEGRYLSGITAKDLSITISYNKFDFKEENNLSGINVQAYMNSVKIKHNIFNSNNTGNIAIASSGNMNEVISNTIDNFDIGISGGRNIIKNNIINNCLSEGIKTINTSFIIKDNIFNNCNYGISIESIIVDEGEIIGNTFKNIVVSPIIQNANFTGMKYLCMNNLDYYNLDTERNLIVPGEGFTIRANLFNNFRYKVDSYQWIEDNAIE